MKCSLIAIAMGALAALCAPQPAAFGQAYPPVEVNAGPIWNDADAQGKCPKVCGGLTWDKYWNTTQPTVMSVCGTTAGDKVPVGPIWSNEQAQAACPAQLAKVKWNLQWRTIETNVKSVCSCAVDAPLAAAWMYLADDQDFNTIPDFWKAIDFTKVDVLLLGPAGVQADGTFGLYKSDKTGDLATRFKWVLENARRVNPSIKIMVSQWWEYGAGQKPGTLNELQTSEQISKYTSSAVQFITEYMNVSGGFDGYDVDYEGNNVVSNIGTILSQIRSGFNTLSAANGSRNFYISVSPAATAYLKDTVPSVNNVNMQTYAGGAGIGPDQYKALGFQDYQLLYGFCPESGCPTPKLDAVEKAFMKDHLAGIHSWRLNSRTNWQEENALQASIYKFLHPSN